MAHEAALTEMITKPCSFRFRVSQDQVIVWAAQSEIKYIVAPR